MPERVERISDGNWKRIQRWAVPLEDNFNDALAKVLDAAEAYREGSAVEPVIWTQPAPAHLRRTLADQALSRPGTWRRRYEEAILKGLFEAGGESTADNIVSGVFAKLRGHLRESDYRVEPSGQQQWVHRVHANRFHLVELGMLKNDSPHGVWQLTDAGRQVAEELIGGTTGDAAA
jgi:hypothetical protein